MSEVKKIKKGLDIKLIGKAEKVLEKADRSETFAIKPTDFPGLTPKLKVKVDTEVKAGSALFFLSRAKKRLLIIFLLKLGLLSSDILITKIIYKY